MADKPSDKNTTTAPAADKTLRCRVVTRYGEANVGDLVEVSEKEYRRLRKPRLDADGNPVRGKFNFPVLITAEDQAKLDEEKRLEEEARLRSSAAADDATTAAGWAAFERQSLEAVTADREAQIARQKQIELEVAERLRAGGASASATG